MTLFSKSYVLFHQQYKLCSRIWFYTFVLKTSPSFSWLAAVWIQNIAKPLGDLSSWNVSVHPLIPLTSSRGFCGCFWKVQVTLAWSDLGMHSKKELLPSTPYSFFSAMRCLWWSAGGGRDKDIESTVTFNIYWLYLTFRDEGTAAETTKKGQESAERTKDSIQNYSWSWLLTI